jgi:hypothetical protein
LGAHHDELAWEEVAVGDGLVRRERAGSHVSGQAPYDCVGAPTQELFHNDLKQLARHWACGDAERCGKVGRGQKR